MAQGESMRAASMDRATPADAARPSFRRIALRMAPARATPRRSDGGSRPKSRGAATEIEDEDEEEEEDDDEENDDEPEAACLRRDADEGGFHMSNRGGN